MVIVAGSGTAGFADGKGKDASFNKPIRLAPLGPDAIVVADIFNHAIRVVSKDGTVRTMAGAPDRKGYKDGAAAEAAFNSPHGVGTSADGRIAVAEAGNNTLRAIAADAKAHGGYVVTALAGVATEKGSRDGPAVQALFNSPHAVLWAADGSLYAPDIGNASIRRIEGGRVETVAGAEKGTFVYPMDIAWAKDGRLLVADAGANILRAVSADGRVTTIETQSPLSTPHGVAAGPDGTIYVADMGSHRVLAIDAKGVVTTVAGVAGEAGGDAMHLRKPAAVLVHAGWLWIADLDNHRICAVDLGN
jgi:DNA-binding beta-propeller fold protein YncE